MLRGNRMGHGKMLTHTRYGERLRKLRRWTHDAFMSKQTLQTYVEVQLRETYILLAGLLESPDEFVSHFTRYAIAAVALFGIIIHLDTTLDRFTAATVSEIAYGHTVTSLDDKYIEYADKTASETVEAGR